ncbi:MAG: tetratricopeptide repeat protein [Verrucomicrobiota bacterium]|nr:tetratricopeptide repeat protein [Limisphaera sp.]MDW8380543.1 tetratricopeptide repeat protein [Verrucomicrobiota bacterium]
MTEKGLNELPREVRDLYERAVDAFRRDNLDYAQILLTQVVNREPAFFDARKLLRQAQQRKATRSSAGFLKRVLSSAAVSPELARARLVLRTNPVEAMQLAEEALNANPNNFAAHRVFAEAAMAAGYPRLALLSYDVLFAHDPRDRELAIQYARALADAGEISKGEQVLTALLRLCPNDPDLAQELKNLSARRTLAEGGYGALESGTSSFRDILRDAELAKVLEQEQRIQKTEDATDRLIRDYEVRIQKEPQNLRLLRSLAELYAQKKDFDRALACYERVKATEAGQDPSLDRAIAETILRRFDHQLAQLDPAAPDHAERVREIEAAKQAFQLEECRKRVEKYPTDLTIRFEYGQLLFEAGRLTEAIAEFQKAQNNPHKRIAALAYLARCFAQRKMYDLAARTLQTALKEKTIFDEEKKELLYHLGSVLEALGKRDEAIEAFKQIYEVDISYRDVAAKVEAYYASQ